MLKYTPFVLLVCSSAAFAMLPNPEATSLAVSTVNFGVANTNIAPQSAMQLNKVGYQPSQAVTQAIPTQTTANPLQTAVSAYLVGADGGLIPITQGMAIKSGDVVEYHAYYTNTSADRIRSFKAQMDIPSGVELVGELSPLGAYASLDGSRFVPTPVRGHINGQIQEVPLSFYKALRWELQDIGIGGTAVVKYRAKIK